MKVLHVINTLSAGGAELHLLTLCRHLKALGIEIVVACLRERVKGSRSLRDDFENAGIRVIALEANGRYDLRSIPRLAALVAKERPSILHTHLPRADLAAVFKRVFSPSLPWVCSVHDIHDKSWSGRWTLPLFNFVWRRADRVIAISHAVKDWLVTERSVPSQRISVIHYGIDPESFSRPQADLRREWGLEGKSIIGAIGRLEPRKGHDCLIRSMCEIKKAIPNAVLLIAGHDPWGYGDELQRLINSFSPKSGSSASWFSERYHLVLERLGCFCFCDAFGRIRAGGYRGHGRRQADRCEQSCAPNGDCCGWRHGFGRETWRSSGVC